MTLHLRRLVVAGYSPAAKQAATITLSAINATNGPALTTAQLNIWHKFRVQFFRVQVNDRYT
jgi:hypothetical protein